MTVQSGNIVRKLKAPLALFMPLSEIELTIAEDNALKEISLDEESAPVGRSFLAWRRRLLVTAMICFLIELGIQMKDYAESGFEYGADDEYFNWGHAGNVSTGKYGTIDLGGLGSAIGEKGQVDVEGLTSATIIDGNGAIDMGSLRAAAIYGNGDAPKLRGLGVVAKVSEVLAITCPMIVVMIGAYFWTDYTKSRRVLVPGWLLQLFLVLWPTIVPLDHLYYIDDTTQKARGTVVSALSLLPVYLSIVSGISQGFTRLFLFAPTPMTGMMVVLGAAFSIFIPFTTLTVAIQIFDDNILNASFLFRILGPTIILGGRRNFTRAPEGYFLGCGQLLRANLICRIVTVVLAFLWLFVRYATDPHTRNLVDIFITPRRIVGKLFQFLAGLTFSLVLWTDIAMQASRIYDGKVRDLLAEVGDVESSVTTKNSFNRNYEQCTIDEDYNFDEQDVSGCKNEYGDAESSVTTKNSFNRNYEQCTIDDGYEDGLQFR
mmetsp:Transcript_20195/g.47285  ORF Transcript_20195/g.47285 Transcript_20195/m.47285 type:complete len:488 (-) Transcript_20195:308-1771(-)